MSGVAGWLIGWILMGLLLYALAQTRPGHTVIYYTAWLLVLFLIITHGNEVASNLSGGNFSG